MRLSLLTLLSVLYITTLVSAIGFKSCSLSVLQTLIKTKKTKSNKKISVRKESLKSNPAKPKRVKETKKSIGTNNSNGDESIHDSEVAIDAFISQLTSLLPYTTPLFFALSFLITWKVNFADKRLLFIARAGFALYMIVAQLIIMYIEKTINALNDLTPVIEKRAINLLDALNPPSSTAVDCDVDNTKGNEETILSDKSITTKDYDLKQIKSYSTNLLMEGAMTTYMHFQQKSIKSLVFAQMMGLAKLLNNNVVKIHLFGMKPIGSLKRPFTSGIEKMLLDAMKKLQEKSTNIPPVAEMEIDTISVTTAVNSSEEINEDTSENTDSETEYADETTDDDDDENSKADAILIDTKTMPKTSLSVDTVTNSDVQVEESENIYDKPMDNKTSISLTPTETASTSIQNAINNVVDDLHK